MSSEITQEMRDELRGLLAEVEAQLGGYGPVVEVRDQIAATIDTSDMFALAAQDYRTAFPYSEWERWAFPPYPNDDMHRVLVRPENTMATSAQRWTRTVDRITGLPIEMRAADCGAGCRCATEVRLLGRFGE